MTDAVIIAILVVAAVAGLLRAAKHFKGDGCCGSGSSSTIRDKKKLDGPAAGSITLRIEGLRCDNCAARIENVLNRFDGVLCTVSHKRKTAVVQYTARPDTAALKAAVEKLGYKVTGITEA